MYIYRFSLSIPDMCAFTAAPPSAPLVELLAQSGGKSSLGVPLKVVLVHICVSVCLCLCV